MSTRTHDFCTIYIPEHSTTLFLLYIMTKENNWFLFFTTSFKRLIEDKANSGSNPANGTSSSKFSFVYDASIVNKTEPDCSVSMNSD